MKILVTGGCGFIGSNFIRYILQKRETIEIVNLDLLTYAGNINNLIDVANDPRYTFVRGDISDKMLVNKILKAHKVDAIINFAAESHVDRSILDVTEFYHTNIGGVLNLLEIAVKQGINKFIQISTDEVYGSLDDEFADEKFVLNPSSPYAASKASADQFVMAYHHTFGLPINIMRSSNNYGPYQFPEKLMPILITNGIQNLPLPIYGKGRNVRNWLYVIDFCEAIFNVLKKGNDGEIYNVAPYNEFSNIEIAHFICREMELSEDLIQYVPDRLGHDLRYGVNADKISSQLGWKPKVGFAAGLKKTIRWYQGNESWWRPLLKNATLDNRNLSD